MLIGTRPEAIKLAPLVLSLRNDPRFSCRVCVTGQHRTMLRDALRAFDITPDVNLRVMRKDQSLAHVTARLLRSLDGEFHRHRPQLVLVQGDTTTVLCGALAGFYEHIPVAHVEAGLRTGDLRAPWPEEGNRTLTSRIAALHFAPTETSRSNLLREGIAPDRVFVTGNTVIDALRIALDRTRASPARVTGLPPRLLASGDARRVVLITGHRRESFGEPFEQVCRAIGDLATRFADVHFIYPVHLNPRVRAPVEAILGVGAHRPNVHLLAPLGYLAFVRLMQRATLILTDSGGIQEEAPSLGKPVLVMRESTERPEAVAAGTVRLVGTSTSRIFDEVARLLTDADAYRSMAAAHNPYGDGRATPRILDACHDYLVRRAADR